MTLAPAKPSDLESVLARTVSEGLAAFVKDTQWAGKLVDWLHGETGVPKIYLRIGVRLFAALLPSAAKGVAKVGGSVGGRVLRRAFLATPGHGKVLAAFGRMNREWAALQEFDAVTQGRLAAERATLAAHLPRDQRVQFITMAWLASLGEALRPQPALTVPLEPETEENRFVFAARRVPFVGRDAEMQALGGFLDADAPFRWWMVEGSGGLGKSRLALQLCLEHAGRWRSGFRRRFADFDWERWAPDAATLLIADYANEVAEELGDAIRVLAERSDRGELAHPVRILLLVRDSQAEWRTRFWGTGLRRSVLERVQHAAPLRVPALDDEHLWTVLRSYVPADAPLPDPTATLERLREIDPERRPLFAAFAGDAIAHGRDLTGWDQESLVRSILEREYAHWEAAGVTEKHRDLYVLATMAGGFPPSDIPENPYLPSINPTGDPFSPQQYRVLAGSAATEWLAPMQPDILGEMFVLEQITPRFGGDPRVRSIVQEAWDIRPWGVFAFMYRAAEDFTFDLSLPLLMRAQCGSAVERIAWSMTAVNTLASYANAGRVENGEQLYAELRALSESHPTDAAVREQRVRGAVNLLYAYRKGGWVDAAERLYTELCALSESHSADAAVRAQWAGGAGNLLIAYSNEGRIGDGERLYAELRALSESHPADAAVREQRANGAVNLLSAYARAGRAEAAERLYAELRALSESHPAGADVCDQRAMGAVNLLSAYEKAGWVEAAERLYTELRALSESHPANAAVRAQRAGGARNLLFAYSNEGRIGDGERLYAELRALSESHPADAAICEQRATGAFNLLSAYAETDQVEDGERLYAELYALSESHPADAAIREQRAKGGVNLLSAYVNAGRVEAAERLYAELRALNESHPADAAVGEQRVNGAVNLLYVYGKVGRAEDGERLYAEFCALSESYSADAAVREQRAKGAVNLLMAYAKAGRVSDGERLYAELRALSEPDPTDAAVRGQRAVGAVNLLVGYAMVNRDDEVRRLYAELRTLSKSHPDEPVLRDAVARAEQVLRMLSEGETE